MCLNAKNRVNAAGVMEAINRQVLSFNLCPGIRQGTIPTSVHCGLTFEYLEYSMAGKGFPFIAFPIISCFKSTTLLDLSSKYLYLPTKLAQTGVDSIWRCHQNQLGTCTSISMLKRLVRVQYINPQVQYNTIPWTHTYNFINNPQHPNHNHSSSSPNITYTEISNQMLSSDWYPISKMKHTATAPPTP